MNHKAPIRNNKLLQEAYESGRRDALNEWTGQQQSGGYYYIDPRTKRYVIITCCPPFEYQCDTEACVKSICPECEYKKEKPKPEGGPWPADRTRTANGQRGYYGNVQPRKGNPTLGPGGPGGGGG